MSGQACESAAGKSCVRCLLITNNNVVQVKACAGARVFASGMVAAAVVLLLAAMLVWRLQITCVQVCGLFGPFLSGLLPASAAVLCRSVGVMTQ
jgi:hypothetical protein